MNWLRWLKQVLWSPPVAVVELRHERLGLLTLEEAGWTASVRHGDQELLFTIGGTIAPDPNCLRHAADIVQDLDAFLGQVRSFLREEASRNKCFAEEILQLRLSDVCVFWPKRPDEAELLFLGPSEDRSWYGYFRVLQPEPGSLGFHS